MSETIVIWEDSKKMISYGTKKENEKNVSRVGQKWSNNVAKEKYVWKLKWNWEERLKKLTEIFRKKLIKRLL